MTRPPVGSTGTLAELQVEPGDVVALTSLPNEKMTVFECPPRAGTFAHHWQLECEVTGEGLYRDGIFRLISRANPDQPAQIISHDGRDYDLTALETPFGLLPEPVQVALDAWPHGSLWYDGRWRERQGPVGPECFVYRAKPAPKETRVQCYRGRYGKAKEHGTCIKRHDGSIDWASWEDA